MNLFLKLFTSYVIAIIFFMGLLPKMIVKTSENPFSYSHVLINN